MEDKGYGSRKFLLSIVTVLIASTLVWFSKIDGAAWTGAIALAVGGYLGANVLASKNTNAS